MDESQDQRSVVGYPARLAGSLGHEPLESQDAVHLHRASGSSPEGQVAAGKSWSSVRSPNDSILRTKVIFDFAHRGESEGLATYSVARPTDRLDKSTFVYYT